MQRGIPVDRYYAPTQFWHALPDGRIQCDLCPRHCRLREGQRGFCFVRENFDNEIVLTTYGRSSGFCIDPIEKKPLNHFLPGTPVFSFGTAGCNLACRFCQNWDISKSRDVHSLTQRASPQDIASIAAINECQSVAFTYNDPVVFYEYARDTADACHELGIKTVAVTANYLTEQARGEFYAKMDAANVDLKAFSEAFYRRLTGARLQPVLDNLEWLVNETDVWVEITNLLIPGENDSDQEIYSMCGWIRDHLGTSVPLHFTAFHPDYRMMNHPLTPTSTLRRARNIAMGMGIRYVYTGNTYYPEGQATYCPRCEKVLICRNGYDVMGWSLDSDGCCVRCGFKLDGVIPARPGDWGSRRLPIRMD